MRPVSSGSRKASRAARGNSGSSSRNSTPWCASEISPGRGGEPPPTSATALAEWCGAAGRPQRPALQREAAGQAGDGGAFQRLVTSWAAAGRRSAAPASTCPSPGGPTSRRLWPPAAAISSARGAGLALDVGQVGIARRRAGRGCSRTQPACVVVAASAARRRAGTNCRPRPAGARAGHLAPGTSAASSALPGGSTSRAPAPPHAAPGWWPARRAPAAARPTATARRRTRGRPARAPSICPLAARMPSAIGRSKRPESLGRSAGARLTVIRLLCGNSSPQVRRPSAPARAPPSPRCRPGRPA
jgi:hypothetical protein